MNPKVKKDWTAALTSGKYRQGREALKQVRHGHVYHCCLGVLCELYIAQVPGAPKFTPPDIDTLYEYEDQPGLPTSAVLKWAGLTRKEANRLAALNDGGDDSVDNKKQSFQQIANYINKDSTTTSKPRFKVIRWENQHGRGTKRVRI